MAEPDLSPAAAIVRRYDPDLFRTALFAAGEARERLMVLYAFDIELSRATLRADRTEQGPIIAEMRLQFWRDVVAGAYSGAEPRAHEIAGPFAALIAEAGLPRETVQALVEARSAELAGGFDTPDFDSWLADRFAGLMRIAARITGAAGEAAERAADQAGRALGIAFALRSAVPMAAQSRLYLLPGLTQDDKSALAGMETTDRLRGLARHLAEQGLAALDAARRGRGDIPRSAAPAFLPLVRAEADLRAAMRGGVDLASGFRDPARAGHLLRLTIRGLTGRW